MTDTEPSRTPKHDPGIHVQQCQTLMDVTRCPDCCDYETWKARSPRNALLDDIAWHAEQIINNTSEADICNWADEIMGLVSKLRGDASQ